MVCNVENGIKCMLAMGNNDTHKNNRNMTRIYEVTQNNYIYTVYLKNEILPRIPLGM